VQPGVARGAVVATTKVLMAVIVIVLLMKPVAGGSVEFPTTVIVVVVICILYNNMAIVVITVAAFDKTVATAVEEQVRHTLVAVAVRHVVGYCSGGKVQNLALVNRRHFGVVQVHPETAVKHAR